jgi:mycothiol synthase
VRPPEPYTARPATAADAAAIACVLDAAEQAYEAEPGSVGEREVLLLLQRATVIVVEDEEGGIVAAGSVTPRGDGVLSSRSTVMPSATGRGLGAFLRDWAEEQARARTTVSLRAGAPAGDERAKRLLTGRGYGYIRSFYGMVVDLDGPPPPPRLPAGITVAAVRPEEERVVYEVFEDSFAEHWGHQQLPFEEWRSGWPLDYELTFLAREGDEAAGTIICHEELFGEAMVGILGVRRQWRGRGLGRALLLHGFGALWERGKRRIALSVDAGNETGALELYRSLGMRVGRQDDVYERGR